MSRGERKAMIVREHPELSLSRQCEVLSISRTLFYYASQGESPATLLRTGIGKNRLSITATTAFATYWLMPRLVDFSRRHPDIEVNLVVSDKYLDLRAEGIDIAIRYDRKPPAIGKVIRLLQEQIFSVFSPSYKPASKLETHSDLLEERLLQLSGTYRPEAG